MFSPQQRQEIESEKKDPKGGSPVNYLLNIVVCLFSSVTAQITILIVLMFFTNLISF